MQILRWVRPVNDHILVHLLLALLLQSCVGIDGSSGTLAYQEGLLGLRGVLPGNKFGSNLCLLRFGSYLQVAQADRGCGDYYSS